MMKERETELAKLSGFRVRYVKQEDQPGHHVRHQPQYWGALWESQLHSKCPVGGQEGGLLQDQQFERVRLPLVQPSNNKSLESRMMKNGLLDHKELDQRPSFKLPLQAVMINQGSALNCKRKWVHNRVPWL